MRYQARTRMISVLMAVCLFMAGSLAAAYIASSSKHDCKDDACLICLHIENNQQLLRHLHGVKDSQTAIAQWNVLPKLFHPCAFYHPCFATLITQKVKMNH